MLHKLKSLTLITILLFSNFAKGEDFVKINWTEGKSAVAWVAKKRMFLVKNVEPVGLNASIGISKDSSANKFVIRIPIEKFDSGEPDRDKEVTSMLKGDVQPDLLFTSDAIAAEFEKSLTQDHYTGKLGGELQIGGKSFPVSFDVKKTKDSHGDAREGELRTTFTAFGIEPPAVAGGLVAKVKDDLTLMFHIYLSDIKN